MKSKSQRFIIYNQQSANRKYWLIYLLKLAIRAYQLLISPLLGPRCRFYPSCSHYALQAFERYGFFKGSILTIKRLCRCHPAHPGGVDEIP